jgi:hypothetical protein
MDDVNGTPAISLDHYKVTGQWQCNWVVSAMQLSRQVHAITQQCHTVGNRICRAPFQRRWKRKQCRDAALKST